MIGGWLLAADVAQHTTVLGMHGLQACGVFLFEQLSGSSLAALISIVEMYSCSEARRLISMHLAHNFEALLEAGTLCSLSPEIWEETLRRDTLAARF